MFRSLARLSDIWFTLLCVGIGAAFITFGVTFLCVQFVTVLLSLVQVSTGLEIYLAAALASLLVVPPLWWFFIIKPRHLTIGQGALVGFIATPYRVVCKGTDIPSEKRLGTIKRGNEEAGKVDQPETKSTTEIVIHKITEKERRLL